jgi:hypothetical protein
MEQQPHRPVTVVVPTKSIGISIILTVLFGPLGIFYSSIVGGAVMLVISVLVGIFTLGFGLFVTWPICVFWGAIAAKNYNDRLLASAYYNTPLPPS